jgi:hypothetical protein
VSARGREKSTPEASLIDCEAHAEPSPDGEVRPDSVGVGNRSEVEVPFRREATTRNEQLRAVRGESE